MKKYLLAILLFGAVSGYAQKNVLLEPSFWQGKPDATQVKAEIDKGANPAQFNNNSFDPVVYAINADAPNESIKYLLEQPGNTISKITHDGRIYLHWAAYRGNVAIVDYLIGKGSNVKLVDSHGATPLTFAASAGQSDPKLYDLFVAKGVNLKSELNGNGANLLLLGIANDKDFKLTDYLIAKGFDINSKDAQGNNAFAYAARAGNVDLLKALIKKGVSVDPNAMVMAAEGSRRGSAPIEVYQYLATLKLHPTAVTKDGRNALHAIVRKPNQKEIIQYFLNAGVDVNQTDVDGNNVFINAAASNRDTAVIAMLLPKVKNINQANKKGLTALTLAVSNNAAEVVRYLIAKGADVKVTDAIGNNLGYYLIQSYATQGPNAGTADFDTKATLLKEKGLNLAAPQKDGNTLYHLAIVKADEKLLDKIGGFGVDINAKNQEGLTVLHRAAMVAKNDALLKYLIAKGAKKEFKTNFDETAYDLAKENESLKGKVTVDFLK